MITLLKKLLNRSAERPWLRPGCSRLWVGPTVDSGVDVTPETAQQVSTVLACVQLISDDIAGLPVRICRRTERGRERVRDHYLHRLLNDQPNEYHTSQTFRSVVMRSMLLHGASFTYIKWQGNRVAGLYPYRPSQVTPTVSNNWLKYEIRSNSGTVTLTQDQILHVLYLTDDGIRGLSPIEVAAQPVGIALAADKYAARFLGSGTSLSGYLRYPGGLSAEAEAELRNSWRDGYAGIDNSHEVPLLMEGGEFVPLSVPPEQAQFLQSRQYQTVDSCRLFKVNPVKIGDLTKSSYATYDAVAVDHVRTCLRPWIDRLEQEWSRKLLTIEEQQQGYYIELDADGLMRGDRQSQDKSFATGIQFGWYSKNDVRDMLNLPPIEGGDEYMTPLNMAPAGQDTPKEPEPTETEDEENAERGIDLRRRDADRLNPLLQDAVRRMLVKECNAIKRAASRQTDLMAWADEWYGDHERLVASAVLPAFTAFDPVTAHGKATDYAIRHVADSLRDLSDALTFDALPDLYVRWANTRPLKTDLGDL